MQKESLYLYTYMHLTLIADRDVAFMILVNLPEIKLYVKLHEVVY